MHIGLGGGFVSHGDLALYLRLLERMDSAELVEWNSAFCEIQLDSSLYNKCPFATTSTVYKHADRTLLVEEEGESCFIASSETKRSDGSSHEFKNVVSTCKLRLSTLPSWLPTILENGA